MKTYFIFLFSLLLCACQSPSNEEIAHNKVSDYLIKGKKSYEQILFGELDSAFTSVKDTKLYKEYIQKQGAFEGHEILRQQYPDLYSDEESKSNKEQEIYYRAICDSLESIFSPQFTGWQMQHIYKYKNNKDEFVVDNYIIFFDENLQTITKREQVYTNLPITTFNQDPNFYGIKE